jgi:protease II
MYVCVCDHASLCLVNRIMWRDEQSLIPINFDEPLYDVDAGPNHNFSSPILRLYYNSMTTPHTVVRRWR